MSPRDLQRANALLESLSPSARELAQKELAGRTRRTGLVATLDWLKSKKPEHQELAAALEKALGRREDMAGMGSEALLHLLHSAHRLTDAIHLVARALPPADKRS